MLNTIESLIADLRAVDGDKPAMHAKVKELIAALNTLEKQTRPGLGDFKWTAAARKGLTKPVLVKGGNPSLIVARGDDGTVWHTDGCYAVKGEPSKRFEPCDYQEIPTRAFLQVIPAVTDDYKVVTVIGGSDKIPGGDAVELSNGALVNRLYLEYVTAAVGEGATIYSRNDTAPVLVRVKGETLGLIMPMKPVKRG